VADPSRPKAPRRPHSAARKGKGEGSPGAASRSLALLVAEAALDKKALAVEILDVIGKVDYADFLVLMTGGSARHVDALAQAIENSCKKGHKQALSVEGLPAAVWVLLDFGDVVVHVFQEHSRGLYDIEGLWLDAKRLPVPGGAAR
jgi:ribosome-associated protein